MSDKEKELLQRFLKWLFDSGLEPLEARFENVAAPDIQSVIDKFEKNEADCRNHTMKLIKYVTLIDNNGNVTGYTGTFALCLQCQKLRGKFKLENTSETVKG